MRRIAFFTDILQRGFDGASRTMFHLIDRIPASEFEILFITGSKPTGDFRHSVVEIPNLKIPFNSKYSMAFPAVRHFKLKRILDKFQPDIVHIASPSLLGNFALDYAESRNLPIISIYHTHFISYVPYYLKHAPIVSQMAQKLVISGQRKFYNRCQKILVPTPIILDQLIQYGFEKERLVIWPRGLDHSIFHPGQKDKFLLRKLIGNDDPVVLFASRLVWEKNLQMLVDVYHKVQNDKRKINFLLVGDGPAKDELRRKMPRAHFIGNVDQEQLAIYYASSDVFLFPSASETYGNVVAEAMACGLPCIVSSEGGSSSFVEQGVNGCKLHPKDSTGFYKCMLEILRSSSLHHQFSVKGRERVADHDWNSLAESYTELAATLDKTLEHI